MPTTVATPSLREIRDLLLDLRSLPLEADPASAEALAEVEVAWRCFPPERWPALFELLTLAADLPRLADNASLRGLAAGLWPELERVSDDLGRLHRLVDTPMLPEEAQVVGSFSLAEALPRATETLRQNHCVTVEDLLDTDARRALDAEVARLAETKMGRWGQLERAEAPGLFDRFDHALASPAFHRLTGWTPGRDEYSLTLSLQDLQPSGIGWHRDLYWPKEWVGQDVFAVLYGLGDDSPTQGGAFTWYVPWDNALLAVYRRHHQATILWNARETRGRLLHAVTGYHGADTSRHLIILQCLRRGD